MAAFQRLILIVLVMAVAGLPTITAQDTLTLSGQVTQGTAEGDPLTDDLPVSLRIISPVGQVIHTFDTRADANGTFQFEAVPRLEDGSLYIISAMWDEIEQTTIPATVDRLSEPMTLPLYETTTSFENVAGRGNLSIDFEDVHQVGLRALLELNYVNLGDRIILPGAAGTPIVELPVGAYGIGIETSSTVTRYRAVTDDAFPVIEDTQLLIPGIPNLMRVSFLIPYEQEAAIDIRFPFPVSDLAAFVREETVELQSNLLSFSETRETSSGRRYDVYLQQENLAAGDPYLFTLAGKPSITVTQPETSTDNLRDSSGMILLVLGLIGSGVLAVIVVVVLQQRGVSRAERKQ